VKKINPDLKKVAKKLGNTTKVVKPKVKKK